MALWLTVAAGLALVATANVHLVYVAVMSQPDCVAHLRSGDGVARKGTFGAAGSACAPPGSGGEAARRGKS
jgi:hypothetical protein